MNSNPEIQVWIRAVLTAMGQMEPIEMKEGVIRKMAIPVAERNRLIDEGWRLMQSTNHFATGMPLPGLPENDNRDWHADYDTVSKRLVDALRKSNATWKRLTDINGTKDHPDAKSAIADWSAAEKEAHDAAFELMSLIRRLV